MEMEVQNQEVAALHAAISKLPSLIPSPDVLFTALVASCALPSLVDVTKLGLEDRRMREDLVRLCSDTEARLEANYVDTLATLDYPLDHLTCFPYYGSYVHQIELEHELLTRYVVRGLAAPALVVFVGSGAMLLSSLLLVARHMPIMVFDNYDRCGAANDRARRLVRATGGDDKGGVVVRMSFHTVDVADLTRELAVYDAVFLAAPVGLEAEEKIRVIVPPWMSLRRGNVKKTGAITSNICEICRSVTFL